MSSKCRGDRNFLDRLTRCRDCDKKKVGSSTDKPGIERCRVAIEPICCELLRGHKVAQSIDLAIKRYRDCDKKKLKSSIDTLAVERC